MISSYASPPRPRRPRAERDHPYARAEHMLERFGLSYVCADPAVLFGSLTPRCPDLAEILAARHSKAPTDARNAYRDCPLDRLAEAYRILQDIYAPYNSAPR